MERTHRTERLRKWRRWMFRAALMGISLVLAGEWAIHLRTAKLLFPDPSKLPHNKVALVLGTTADGRDGGANPYFVNRIAAAAALYHAGKVDHLLLTGDNGSWGYNEPMDMRSALMMAGVDSTDMTLDFAGFSTYDSVVRARKVFGQQRFTIVSQRFHNQRALFIARAQGIDAIGHNAADPDTRQTGWTWIRERGARLKMWKDLLLGVEPHFLGDPVKLGGQVLP